MALLFVASGSDLEGASTTFTFDYGFSPVDGNILVATVTHNNSTILTAPSGWTTLGGATHDTAYTIVVYKVAGAAEPTSETFTSTSGKWAGGIVEYSGQDTTTPINNSITGNGASVNPLSSSILPTVDNCVILAGFGINNTATQTVEARLTQRWNQLSTAGAAVGTAGGTELQTTAESTPDYYHTISASQSWFAYTVAIAPEDTSTYTLIMDSGDISLSGTDATFINEALTSEPQSLWFPSGTWKEPTFGQVTWGAPSSGDSYSLICESGDISLSGTDAEFTLFIGDLTLSMDSGDISLSGTDADFIEQAITRTADVQAALDLLLEEDTIDIYKKDRYPPYIHWYCVGIRVPYMGKAMWVRCDASDSPTDQAAEIADVMLQDGNYDPDFS